METKTKVVKLTPAREVVDWGKVATMRGDGRLQKLNNKVTIASIGIKNCEKLGCVNKTVRKVVRE